MEFTNRVVIVSGGAVGMGRAIADGFAKAGAKVIIADWNETDGEEASRIIQEKGGSALFLKMDVTRQPDVEAVIGRVIDEWGRVDILVSNIGTHLYKRIVDIELDEWDRLHNTDLRGAFLLSKCVLPHMIQKKSGALVFISSPHAIASSALYGAYAAAKGGIVSMARSLAIEYAPYGVRINTVLPGWAKSAQMDRQLQHLSETEKMARLEQWGSGIPLGRVAEPEDIANAVLFLAGDKSSYITGIVLPVDGGLTSRLVLHSN